MRAQTETEAVIFDFDGTLVHLNIDFDRMRREVEDALTLERLEVNNPLTCFMVGDHILDIEAGKRLGMKTAGVLTGKTSHGDFLKAGAGVILDHATKIPACIFKESAE